MKTCCKFKSGKCASLVNPQPTENFAKDKKRKDGLTPHCKSCLKVYRDTNKEQRSETIKAWRLANPDKMIGYRVGSSSKNKERVRKWRLKNPEHRLRTRYDISTSDWQQMFEDQKGHCAICLKHSKDLRTKLHVDHCHDTKKVRGLLCERCNRGIGQFEDSIELLEKAIAYLKK